MRFRLTRHAEEELTRRGISRSLLEGVLAEPDQVVPAGGGRKVCQSKFDSPDGTMMLLRVIVDDRVDPPVVVTVYRTSKIEKYWSAP